MSDARTIALGFIERWSGGYTSLRSSFGDYFTQRTVWENIGLNRLVGIDEACVFADAYRAKHGFAEIRADIIGILSNDRFVMTERVDHMLRDDGSEIHATKLMGIFEIENGKIIAQRDYFCPAVGQ